MKLRPLLKWTARVVVGLVLVVAAAFTYVAWWRHPKRATDNAFIRPAGPEVFKLTDVPRDHEPTDAQVEAHVDKLLAEMSLVEKVHQMAGDTWIWDLLKLVAFEHYKYNDRPIPSGRNVRLGVPPLLFSDGPRGVVLNHSTAFPVAMARGATWDRALERRVADAIGEELRAQGANFYGGVCINVLRHPGWGRAQETYGEDPYLLGEMATALIQGVQRHNVMACAKHFALNSIDEPRNFIDVRADERTLREVYLPHFKKAVDAGVAAIMSSYNKVNGDYCGRERMAPSQGAEGRMGLPRLRDVRFLLRGLRRAEGRKGRPRRGDAAGRQVRARLHPGGRAGLGVGEPRRRRGAPHPEAQGLLRDAT